MNFLLIFSIVGGSIFLWFIFPFFNLVILNFFLKIFILLVCFLGILFGIFFFNYLNFILFNFKNIIFLKLNYFFSLIWFIPIIFCNFFNILFLKFINKYKLFLDLGWIEYFGGGIFINFYLILKFFININFKLFFLLILGLLIFYFL